MKLILTTLLFIKDYISEHPHIGAIGGLGSGIFLAISSFFTDEAIIKAIGVSGVWMGFFIALLTIIIKLFDTIKALKEFFYKGKKQ